jgi:hypothetical protein
LFIAAMLMIVAVVQAPRSTKEGGVVSEAAVALSLESFETLVEFRLQDGWSPRFHGALDPDQKEPWPFGGGFGCPWEPPSPYLSDQGLALNGPGGRSEVVLWRRLEWRHYRFQAPLVSARLDPSSGNRLLVTLQRDPKRFETQLLEIPEGRVLWSVDSGPWSRFSWDGKAVLLGLADPGREAILLSALPVEGDIPEASLAAWDEKDLPAPPRHWVTKPEQLWDDGKDLPGARVLVPWESGARLWFPRSDRLWISSGGEWSCWELNAGLWRRLAGGPGILCAQPPFAMGKRLEDKEGKIVRERSEVDKPVWMPVAATTPEWPVCDPAWAWLGPEEACTAWDQRWGPPSQPSLPKERQREALLKAFRPEWRTAAKLRASVRGWLPQGPEVALREAQASAWVWIGERIALVRLQPSSRHKILRDRLKAR